MAVHGLLYRAAHRYHSACAILPRAVRRRLRRFFHYPSFASFRSAYRDCSLSENTPPLHACDRSARAVHSQAYSWAADFDFAAELAFPLAVPSPKTRDLRGGSLPQPHSPAVFAFVPQARRIPEVTSPAGLYWSAAMRAPPCQGRKAMHRLRASMPRAAFPTGTILPYSSGAGACASSCASKRPPPLGFLFSGTRPAIARTSRHAAPG